MIKLFRKIRYKLLSDSKFRRYLVYASGEIVLLVIGILVALQVNTWNQNRLDTKEEEQLLQAILVDPLKSSTKAHRFYEKIGFQCLEERVFAGASCLVYELKKEHALLPNKD